ncbi:MAG: SDR family NAD(P)-dependent oxidoreductase [Roseiflexaceae bacterium]|nr:SDR family NAD(P)-dependent oxidoreductase [Roseiflexaceae bacterium]
MTELSGKGAIVTGGAGALGAAVVEQLLEAGAAVFVPYEDAAHFARLRERFSDPLLSGGVLDLTDEAAVARGYRNVAEQLGGVDILVNIAGGFAGGKPVHATAWQVWQQQLDVNLKTTVLSCAAAVPLMLARGGGAVINVGSRTALQPGANMAAYGVAKRGVLGLTEALAAELRDQHITANAVLPSVIDTPANRAANPGSDYSDWVQPAEIARVIRFLVGPHARVISGAAIPVYGRA